MKPRYRAKLAEYRSFVESQWPAAILDWSDAAALAFHGYESRGVGTVSENNGYAIGKRWCDWQVSFWTDELNAGRLLPGELKNEPMARAIPMVAPAPAENEGA